MAHIPEKNSAKPNLSKHRIQRYLKRHHLANTPQNRKRARQAIKRRFGKQKDPEGKDITFQESAADWQIIYGRQRVGGVFTYAATANNNTELLLVITIACHRINAVRKVFFDDVEVTFGTDPPSGWSTGAWVRDGDPKVFIQVNLGSEHQTALSQLITDSGGQWTSNHRQRGCAHVYLKLKYNEHLFPNGLPDIAFEVEGKINEANMGGSYPDEIYTTNPVHCVADLLMDRRYGARHWVQNQFLAATLGDTLGPNSNEYLEYCDELVPLASGGNEKRFTLNVTFLASESLSSILEQMLSSFGGFLVDFGPTFWWTAIVAPKYIAPTVTLTEDDLLSDIQITTIPSMVEYLDSVGGTYVEPNKGWEETDFPAISFGSTPVSRDDISLPCTISATMAQRLAKLELFRRRIATVAKFRARVNLYKVCAGDRVYVTIAHLGWTQKIFEVQTIQLVLDDDEQGNPYVAVEFELKTDDTSVYDWNTTEEQGISTPPNLGFPLPGVSSATSPTNVTAQSGNGISYVQTDGTIVNRIFLQWTAPTDGWVLNGGTIEVQHKIATSSDWITSPDLEGNQTNTYIYNVDPGALYDIRLRGIQVGGLEGPWVQTQHTVQQITSAPPNVTNFIGVVSGSDITLTWDPIYSNIAFYRIKKSTGGQTWGESTLIGEQLGQPFVYGSYSVSDTYKIKAVNTLGIESVTETNHQLASSPVTGNPHGLLLAITYA